LYVSKRQQSQGIGTMLMLKAIDLARARQSPFIWLGVWEKNTKAIAFYTQLGFEEYGEQHFQLGSDRQRDILMKLLLN